MPQTTVNGITMSYTDEGTGPALVFIHGFPLSRGAWDRQVDAFRAHHRVIAPDLRGLGQTEAQSGTNSMDRFAGDVHSLLQQLGTGPVVLAGHSMGGYVALAFARNYPQALRGLVLVGTKAGADTPEGAAGRRATAEKVKLEGIDGVVNAMAPKMLAASNQDAKMAAAVRALMEPSKPEGVIGALLGMAERPDSTPKLGQIKVPTLVITGADDTVIPPAESDLLAKNIPGAQLRVIPNAGHLVAFERPKEFNAALEEWLHRAAATA
jgi:pimeloyl-ACP methyl ester carboxylesterase